MIKRNIQPFRNTQRLINLPLQLLLPLHGRPDPIPLIINTIHMCLDILPVYSQRLLRIPLRHQRILFRRNPHLYPFRRHFRGLSHHKLPLCEELIDSFSEVEVHIGGGLLFDGEGFMVFEDFLEDDLFEVGVRVDQVGFAGD